ncbi:GNAT family N-acetyltransferase [Chitinophaga arvensicola]|uniref:FR47-like protein n=1 Tax=Chitinophaga arvensicola TaxID=29529 RepID=A0A1I0S6Z1_9BACT|nr:GNAT family N-acetyltransferase [Chitinophaga arvensicola]SEW51310.1 FR47-like protein [Chitinophaga arvensicola]
MKETILDNPAWGALTSEHAHFAQGTASAKRYPQEVLPFIAVETTNNSSIAALDNRITPGESFFIIGELPVLPEGWTVENELPCAQMLLTGLPAPLTAADAELVSLLGPEDADDMYTLINSIQPGYYKPDTRLLGNYYGIRQEGRLVAMAGERMRMTGFTELSAICTHPDFTGRGYAQKLITRLCHQQGGNGITSFLHVALSNERAIRLYEHMGFAQRRVISFHRVKKQP